MDSEKYTHYVFVAGGKPESLKKVNQAALRSAGLAFVFIGHYEAAVTTPGTLSEKGSLTMRHHNFVFHGKYKRQSGVCP